ncbi:bisanhydrobacterioruberin hydratase [Halomarina ordinaria]|uniref:Bisanhydrobacterioruberin hydratase n=1 Tax=Halomarina ordinaria TaxID=3033939 RepID=A0ABD5U496_9EURY|nr:bisanhydrobacterioruberin hydratase [Halomarina sp. PSRA2]
MSEVGATLTRARVETRLDDLVRENRFLIAVVFPAVGAVLLLASAEGLLGPLNYNPYLILMGVLVMRLPLVAGVAPLVDRRATVALLALAAYAYGIEYVGVSTGWPYGAFEYTIDLGPMLFGKIPVGLPVFFFPLVLNSYLLCLLLLGDRARRAAVRLPVVVAAVLAMDLVLDPAAVAIGFWEYANGGIYYDVPVSNYLGWVVSATVAVAAFDYGFDRSGLRRRVEECEFMLDDLVSFVLLWGPVNAYFGNWFPVLVAGLFGLGLVVTDRFDFDVRDSVPWR